MSKRIILVSPSPPPLGGMATWTKGFMESKEIKSSKVFLVDSSVKRRITNKSFFTRVISGVKQLIYVLSGVLKEIRSFEVIYVNTSASLGLIRDLLLLICAKIFRKKIIFHYHFGRIPALSKKKNTEWILLLFIANGSDGLILIDQNSYQVMKNKVDKSISIHYIPNPVSEKLLQIAKSDTTEQENSLLFVGHVVKEKGVEELIKAFLELNREELSLVIVGPYEKKYLEYLLFLMKDSSLKKNVKFIGPLNNDEVLALMKRYPVLVLPSYSEGFPYVILEAMASGCIVLGSDVGAIPQMLEVGSENQCGYCFRAQSVDALVATLEDYLLLDIRVIRHLSSKAKSNIIHNYASSIIIKEYLAVINETIQK